MSTSSDEPIIVPPVDEDFDAEQVTALLAEPEPQFDKLVLTVGSGDTMESCSAKTTSASLS